MLEHLRRRVIDLMEHADIVTLSTWGPAGIQAQVLSCTTRGLWIYLLVPATSDHLFNLENHPDVVVTTPEWQLAGHARALSPAEIPPDLPLPQGTDSQNYTVVAVRPSRMQIGRPSGGGYTETIDIVEDPGP